jgi:TolB-like protein/tetratricopeptide (TPR) repeat protein
MRSEQLTFGEFQLDLGRRELSRDGTPVPLKSRALDILCVLTAARGEVVSKDELMVRVWGRVVVEENNIQVHISALRKALDEGKGGQSFIITVPGRGYRFIGGASGAPGNKMDAGSARISPVFDKPSIAILPFANLSGDPEQEYFADGIVEEITTALSRMRWLFVIARNSSFTYKGRTVDVKQVGAELGVRYVLEGSVRKAASRVRISGQLVDASTSGHLWADRFDGALDDIFDLQDRVTASVVGAMAPKLEQAEIERARRKPTESLDAYDYFLRGMASAHRLSADATSEALRLFARASELDPDFAAPNGLAGYCYVVRKMNGWISDESQEVAEAARLSRRAIDLGRDDAVALSFGGLALGYVAGELEDAAAAIDRAVMLNPNSAAAWYASGTVRTFRGGEPDVAIEHLARAMRLSPLDPFMFSMQGVTAVAHFLAGRYVEATAWAEKAFRENPRILGTLRIAAASNALAGRHEEAQKALARALQLDPHMRGSNLRERIGAFRRFEDFAKYAEALIKAGLPQ